MSDLALFGGSPVRQIPFQSTSPTDHEEWQSVKKVLERREFSRFMGSPSKDIERVLTLTSAEAEQFEDPYFSFLGGKMVRLFEADFAKKFNVGYAVSMNSATSALSASLAAAGVEAGDEVITTCMSFNATATSILLFNAIPVFVDIDPVSYCLDPLKIEAAITSSTRAIMVVHLLGNAADMDAILDIAERHHLKVIEDCAQAPGTLYRNKLVGTIGDIGVFSFQETKNITTGEGGMAITKDPLLAKRLRLIRNHGESIPDETWTEESLSNLVGMNFRMTELTAALGVAQLSKLDRNNQVRTENAYYLAEHLKNFPGISSPSYIEGTVPHIFALLYHEQQTALSRGKIIAALRAEGIPVGSGYLRLVYENPLFLKRIAYGRGHCPWSCQGSGRVYRQGDCPIAETLLRQKFIWYYHINAPNSVDDMKDVVRAFEKIFENKTRLKYADINERMVYKW